MSCPDDTIAAISTPPGQGGIGIVRLSGPEAIAAADRMFRPKKYSGLLSVPSHRVIYGHIINPADGGVLDEALLTVMQAPNSYTREDVVEISCHGGFISARKVLELSVRQGARLAAPGEFTKRAFLNGRIDLSQAEAVLDMINARTGEGMKIACSQLRGRLRERLGTIREGLIDVSALVEAYIDFPEDEMEPENAEAVYRQLLDSEAEIKRLSATFEEARFFRDGLSVAIIGRPNVGKSSLLNVLLQKERAIVTDLPGTTRDLIEDFININGLPIRIVDTAGLRHSSGIVEQEGIKRSLLAIDDADFVIAIFDGSEPLQQEDMDVMQRTESKNRVYAISKKDLSLSIAPDKLAPGGIPCVHFSSVTGEGIEQLKSLIFELNIQGRKDDPEGVVVTNIRHKSALDSAASAISRACLRLWEDAPREIVAIEIRSAIDSIGEITGAVTNDEILDRIFSSFCIGK